MTTGFSHGVIDPTIIKNPIKYGLIKTDTYKTHGALSEDLNGHFTVPDVLAILVQIFGDAFAVYLLSKNPSLLVRLTAELCLDYLRDDDVPKKDLQLSILGNFLPKVLPASGNNLKEYRKNVQAMLKEFDVAETVIDLLENILIQAIRSRGFLNIVRFAE